LEPDLSAGLTATFGKAGADGRAKGAFFTFELAEGTPAIGWNGCSATAGAVGFAAWPMEAIGASGTAGAVGFAAWPMGTSGLG
jgi:hypothetical protein